MEIVKTEEQIAMLHSYEEQAQKYFYRDPSGVNTEWIDRAVDLIPAGGTILEIGGGNGWLADYLEEKGYRVERTDGVKAFVEYQQSTGKEAYILDLFTDELKKSHFDLVILASVIHHFTREQLPLVFNKIFVGLKPGGRMALRTKSGDGEGLFPTVEGVPVYYCYWNVEELRLVLEVSGFREIDVYQEGPKHIVATARK